MSTLHFIPPFTGRVTGHGHRCANEPNDDRNWTGSAAMFSGEKSGESCGKHFFWSDRLVTVIGTNWFDVIRLDGLKVMCEIDELP